MEINHMQDMLIEGTLRSKDHITQLICNYSGLVFEYNAIINVIPNTWKAQMNSSINRFAIKTDVLTETGLTSTLSNE